MEAVRDTAATERCQKGGCHLMVHSAVNAAVQVFREEQGAGSADRVLAQYSAEAVSGS